MQDFKRTSAICCLVVVGFLGCLLFLFACLLLRVGRVTRGECKCATAEWGCIIGQNQVGDKKNEPSRLARRQMKTDSECLSTRRAEKSVHRTRRSAWATCLHCARQSTRPDPQTPYQETSSIQVVCPSRDWPATSAPQNTGSRIKDTGGRSLTTDHRATWFPAAPPDYCSGRIHRRGRWGQKVGTGRSQ